MATSAAFAPPEGCDAGYVLFPKDRRTTVSDGTPLAWTVLAPAPGTTPRLPVIAANGWSCSDVYWAGVGPGLAAHGHPVIIVDPRGHGCSGLPRPPGRGARALTAADVSVERFARDLLEVTTDAGFDEVIVIGHSMGVQVALETQRVGEGRVTGLGLIAGSYENPLRSFWGLPLADITFPVNRLAVTAVPELTSMAMQSARVTPLAWLAAKALRGTGPKATPEAMVPYFRHLAAVDPAVMIKVIESLRGHSAAPQLPEIDVPVLILAAGHDSFTPPGCSRTMFERIPTAEIQWFPEAGHTLPIEEPEAIVDHLDEWYRRRVAPRG